MEALRLADFTMGPLFVTLLLGAATIILSFWYTRWKQSYWKKRGIPYVKPYPFMGSFPEYMVKPTQLIDLSRSSEFGRIYGHYEGNRALLSVAEPEILRNILVKDFPAFAGRRRIYIGDKVLEKMISMLQGEDWKRVRTIVSPTFTTGKLKRMLGIFNECSKTMVKNFREASEKGESIEAKDFYSAFTMDSIANSAFSTKLDSHNDPNNKFVTSAKQFFTRKMSWRLAISSVLFFIAPELLKLLKFSFFPSDVSQFFTKLVLDIIEERKRTGETRNDFLQLLLDTAKESADECKLDLNEKDDIAENYGKIENNQIFKGYYIKKSLSHDELVAQCVIFLLGGFETAASTLSFVSYALAMNPEVQEKLIQEVDEALESNNGELTYAAFQSMKYLDNVIAEALRLYPPLIRLERQADANYKLADTGLTIPKGMIITIPIYAMHRDPELFPDPEKFDPDRFSPEERAKQVPYSYLPFGAGPRNCMALRFALMQVKVCVAHVVSNFRIKTCPETVVPLEYELGLGFLQPKSIKLFMEIRKDSNVVF